MIHFQRIFHSFPHFRSLSFYIRCMWAGHVHTVYDQIIGIVDYENIQIFGITCALAWQLPHSTIEPVVTAAAAKPLHNENITVRANAPMASSAAPVQRIDLLHSSTYYDRRHYHEHSGSDLYSAPNSIPLDFRGDERPIDDRQTLGWNGNQNYRIYPALRMRRYIDTHDVHANDANIHPDVSAQLRNHRDTRFELYRSIEKYLDG